MRGPVLSAACRWRHRKGRRGVFKWRHTEPGKKRRAQRLAMVPTKTGTPNFGRSQLQ